MHLLRCSRRCLLLSCLAAMALLPRQASAQLDVLQARLDSIAASIPATAGIAVKLLGSEEVLSVNGHARLPMQSVYKFPLALAVLNAVEEGELSLDQICHLTPEDLLPDTWSPLRDDHPGGYADVTVRELLRYTVSLSDNNGCDVLFRLLGGPRRVEDYIHRIDVTQIAIRTTEAEMARRWPVQYRNWAEPLAVLRLLEIFYEGGLLTDGHRGLLLQWMTETPTGPQRLKGLLPPEAGVAHKTGTSSIRADGLIAATNDAGILLLPDGRAVAVVVLVSDARADRAACEALIARTARAVWDYCLANP
ncbi:MAG: class A beta-lactamase [Bacteroidia bacterium]|nr:class A beta-lactamase [Bacteroidia bacterium]